nr:MAG TPA: hypothetical protein [Caudoviricetes sp.]
MFPFGNTLVIKFAIYVIFLNFLYLQFFSAFTKLISLFDKISNFIAITIISSERSIFALSI